MRILVILTNTLLLVVLVAACVQEPGEAAGLAFPLVFLGYLAWWLLAYPRLVVEQHRITVVNPFKTHVLGFAHLVDVSTKYGLHLITAERTFHAVGAPSGGAGTVKRSNPDHLRHHALLERAGHRGGLGLGDLTTTVSGQAAHVIIGHWTEQIETGQLREAEAPPTSRWNLLPLSVAVLLAIPVLALW